MSGRTFLVVIAHPDDAELTCDGTIARVVRAGDRAILVLATDGARGGKEVGSDFARMVQTRQEEQRRAAEVVGYETVVFLGFRDGELEENDALRGALVQEVRRYRPDVAIVMDPLTVIYRNAYINHRDHRVLGMALLDALYPQASNAGYFAEQIEAGLQPHKVPETWLTQSDHVNHWEDVSDTLDVRFQALRAHTSQMRLWPDGGDGIIAEQRAAARMAGVTHGVLYAEEFRRIVVNPLS